MALTEHIKEWKSDEGLEEADDLNAIEKRDWMDLFFVRRGEYKANCGATDYPSRA